MSIASEPALGSVRLRLISAADSLFYAEGIHAVGIDRVLREAGVAKASLYHHFASKDELVVAYLERRSEQMQMSLRARLAKVPSNARIRLGIIFEEIWTMAGSTAFRGCPFINAAAEYPQEAHPVRAAVTRHRQSFAALIAEQLTCAGFQPEHTLVESVAMAYDGCMVAAQVDSPQVAERAGKRALDALMTTAART